MNITIDDIIARYGSEVAKLTQRAILAEARADALEAELAELKAAREDQPST